VDSTISRRIASTCAAFFCVDAKRVFTTTRCAKTGTINCLKSSGVQNSRPSRKARACAARWQHQQAPRANAERELFRVARALDNVDGIVAQAVVDAHQFHRALHHFDVARLHNGGNLRRRIASPLCCCIISRSLSRDGYPMPVRSRNRSSCDSGRGYVPWCSMGFCVASTMNGRGSLCVWLSTVTCASFMASSSADCVFGRRAIDFVRQYNVGENRARLEIESLLDLVEYAGANHVRRQQVRSKLDALERAVERVR